MVWPTGVGRVGVRVRDFPVVGSLPDPPSKEQRRAFRSGVGGVSGKASASIFAPGIAGHFSPIKIKIQKRSDSTLSSSKGGVNAYVEKVSKLKFAMSSSGEDSGEKKLKPHHYSLIIQI